MKEGLRLKYTGNVSEEQIHWGGCTDPREVLTPDKEYEVEEVIVHSWHTKIIVKGIDGKFNSAWFEGFEIDDEDTEKFYKRKYGKI